MVRRGSSTRLEIQVETLNDALIFPNDNLFTVNGNAVWGWEVNMIEDSQDTR